MSLTFTEELKNKINEGQRDLNKKLATLNIYKEKKKDITSQIKAFKNDKTSKEKEIEVTRDKK